MRPGTRRRNMLVVVSGIAALLCVFAGSCPTDAQAGDEVAVPVTCKVLAALEATFPGAVSLGNLSAGDPPAVSALQTVTVRSNASWTLSIKSDAQDGRLRQWTGTAYASPNPKVLSAPLEWKRQDVGSFTPISASEAQVVSSMPATGSAGTAVSIVFRQSASYDDDVLSDPGHIYRIEVTYAATQTY